jgi:hypothetical protein
LFRLFGIGRLGIHRIGIFGFNGFNGYLDLDIRKDKRKKLTDIGFGFSFGNWIITYWTVVFLDTGWIDMYQSTSDAKLSLHPLWNNSFNT